MEEDLEMVQRVGNPVVVQRDATCLCVAFPFAFHLSCRISSILNIISLKPFLSVFVNVCVYTLLLLLE